MSYRKFWPWDFNSEGEIYENVSWDLPGHRPKRRNRPKSARSKKPGISTGGNRKSA
jgi:hypothetical protein